MQLYAVGTPSESLVDQLPEPWFRKPLTYLYTEQHTDVVPSQSRSYLAVALTLLGIGALLYSVLVLGQFIVGAGVAVAAFATATLVYYYGANRRTLTRATIIVTVVYGVFTLQLPLAIIAACAVYLSAWLTGPDTPFNAPDTEIIPVEQTTTEESDRPD